MKKWTDLLNEEVYIRLANCTSVKRDILPLTQAKWTFLKDNGKYDKEDILVSILDLLDSNGRFMDLSKNEYADILASIN